MAIYRSDPEENYTKIPNELLRGGGSKTDYKRKDGLKPESLGVLTYLLSHKEDFQVTINSISGHFCISKDRTRRILKDLQRTGYIRRSDHRSESGRIEKWDFDIMDVVDPDTAKTSDLKIQNWKTPLVEKSTQSKTKKKSNTKNKVSSDIAIADAIARCPNGVDQKAFQTWVEKKSYRGSITKAKLENCVTTFEVLRRHQCSDYRRAINVAIEKGWHSVEPHYNGIKQLCAVQEKPQSDRENILLAVVK